MEAAAYIRFIAGFLIVMALLGGFAWGLRRYGHKITGLGLATPRTATPRLALVEVLPIDPRRRLVLVRRDGTEHLLLLSPEAQTVVEAGITPAAAEPQP
jgi:flagellar protein FliO/FliZ